jgi:regulatory protein YycH of two-component signal transduction system YycFG
MKDTKARKITRHVALLILAIASIVLSWVIWTNPARYERAKQVSSEKVQSNQVSRDKSDVILPTRIVYTNSDQKQELINNSKKSLPKALVKEISGWKMASVTRVSRGNKERFLDYAMMSRSLMLKYPSNITGKIFNSIYNQKLNTNAEISQIVVNLDKKNEFFLLNDKTYDVYQAKVSAQSLKNLRKLAKSADQQYAVKEMIMNHNLINEYKNSVKVPYYSFLVNKESSSVFTANLLTNTDADSIDTKKVKGGTEYVSSDTTKRLLIKNDGFVTFNDTSKAGDTNESLKKNIEQSFYQMKQLGVQVDNMRYFNFHDNDREVEFRDFVAGFPIFNSDGLDTIKVSRQSKQTTTSFSIYNLDVPVPTSKSDKELPSTQDMLDELEYSGINTDKIEDIDIGYERPSTSKTNSTVELEPTWFIKYHGDWTSYRDLVS